MRRFNLTSFPQLAFLLTAMLVIPPSGCSANDDPPPLPAPRDGAFAVVELFTSEGCSSCPPADALLGKITDEARQGKLAIFPIAFHIDYWDGLGWRDRFSLPESTARQRQYAQALGSDLYTPQMVVNGRIQFVGSDADAAQRAIADALSTPPASHLNLEVAKSGDHDLSITYKTSDAPPGSVLNLVLIQRSASTDVPRGENAGHTLHHFNIARSIKTISLATGTGTESLNLPADLNAKDALVIGFLQNPQSMQILAATKVDPASAPAPAR